MDTSFENFIKERKYLYNVSDATVVWYEQSFAWLKRFPLTEDGLKQFVIAMREAGLKPISCNNRIRVANAYLKWAGLNSLKIRRLKEEETVLPTFTAAQIDKLIHYRPDTFYHHRLHALLLTLLDTGLRIDEALSLQVQNADFDNMLLTVVGKGRKERKIPFSVELRKVLWRYIKLRGSPEVSQ